MKTILPLIFLFLITAYESGNKEKDTGPMTYQTTGAIELLDEELKQVLDVQASPEILGEGYDWVEGPVWVEEHEMLLFSDIPRNRIYRWKEGEGISVYLEPAGYTGQEERGGELGSNGLWIGQEGRLLLCQHGDRRIARMEAPLDNPALEFTTLADNFENQKLNSPNDLAQHSDGSIYFTDPPYGLEGNVNDPAKELDFQGVYRIAPSGELTLLTDELSRPNGIAFSPDEKTLYVANSDPDHAVWMAYTVQDDESIADGRILTDASDFVGKEPGLPDGMTVDKDGYIYATGPGGVWIFAPDGRVLGEITVTDEDPAVGIMREVIRRKQEWRRSLQTYRAEAYTRQTLSNDTSIIMITESISEAFWDREEGHREVLKSRKQTANIQESNNFAGVRYLPNFYDDNVEIAGFYLMGVTHPDALKFYDFKLTDQHSIDDQLVYEIEVTPAQKLQPLFEGTVYVLDEAYALLEVSIRPNEVVTFPPPIKNFSSYYEQQFNNYGKDYWLPVDVRIDGTIKISMVGLEFPLIQFRQISHLTNYQVNAELPDSLYETDRTFTVDSSRTAGDSLKITSIETIPLSEQEEKAYATLDSTATLEKAFKPSGFLARFIDDDAQQSRGSGFLSRMPGNLSPQVRFNRVDELFTGLGYRISPNNRLRLLANAGYSTGYEQWSYGGGVDLDFLRTSALRGTAGIAYHSKTDTRYRSPRYNPGATTLPNLLGNTNYFDFYRNEGFQVYSTVILNDTDWSFTGAFKSEKHISLATTSMYDILGQTGPLQVNPPIDEGRLRALTLESGYNLDEELFLAGIFTGLKRIKAEIEYSSPDLGSDFDYATYRVELDWNFPTFYKRRLLPNTLDLSVTAGTYSGILPLQKMGITDVVLGYFSPFETLRSIRNRPYEGEQYLSLTAEHNFRTIPFEAAGLNFIADRNIGLIIFGGLARTWLAENRRNQLQVLYGFTPRTADSLHIETGISINGLFGFLRVDFAARLDEPAFMINYSLARMF